jgi:hypothetical protein
MTLRVSGSHFATLLGRRHPPGSHQRAGPHTGQSLAEVPEVQEQILSGKVLQRLSYSVRHFGIFLLHSFALSDLK